MKSNQQELMINQLFFHRKPCLKAHIHGLLNHSTTYLNTLQFICESGTLAIISTGTKARILAALHITGHHKMVTMFLHQHCEVIDIVKALNILDRRRKIKQLERRIVAIESKHPPVIMMKPQCNDVASDQDSRSASEKEHQQEEVEEQQQGHDQDKPLDNQTVDPMYKQDENDPPSTFHNNYIDSSSVISGNNDKTKKRKRRSNVDKYRKTKATLESEDGICRCEWKHDIPSEWTGGGSVSGALARKVKEWTRKCLSSDFLEFTLLAMPLDAWRQLADLVHFSPDDFAIPYFLKEVFNEKTTEYNFVSSIRELLAYDSECSSIGKIQEKFFAIAQDFPQIYLSYSLIRRYLHVTSIHVIMEEFASRAPLDTIIWFFEEFHKSSKICQDIVSERIKGGQEENNVSHLTKKSKLTAGKLIERILTLDRMGVTFANALMPTAEKQLKTLRSFWNHEGAQDIKVAVFGDASSSMQSAIEAATIFGSTVSVCFDGELSFFSTDVIVSPHLKPGSASEALEVCRKVQADGCTSLAAALWPYYSNKVFMDMFVLVTDEEENTRKNGYTFAELLAAYKDTVNSSVLLVVVCVGEGNAKFRADLKGNNIDCKFVHVDYVRPDHAKFDALLGQLALLSGAHQVSIESSHEMSTTIAVKLPSLEHDFVLVEREGEQ